ncbi:MAG: glycosyltransferase family 4 protein [Bacteroidales bacterium]|nr:glycosyltransferase family 4 protein [Bacteroidales bacterium]
MDRKRFLFILPFFPWPLVSGGHQGIFNNIRAVSSFAEVHLAYYAGQKDQDKRFHDPIKEALGGDVSIHPYIDKPLKWTRAVAFRKIGNKVFKKVDHFSYSLHSIKLHDEAYYRFVNDLIARYRIDFVQVEMAQNMDFILTLPEQVKRIFVHHELCYVRNAQLIGRYGETAYSHALFELEKIREIALLNRYDMILTVSDDDKKKLIEEGVTAPIHASFSIVNTPAGRGTGERRGSCRAVYVGPEAHYPNKLGLQWFLDEVWPLVKERNPLFRLDIVGRWSQGTAADWTRKYKDIHFLGFVDNLSDALQECTMIVPIKVGSGIRMKILEAMSLGVPFVSTVVGAEGIPVVNGVHGFVTDDPQQFADSLMQAEDPAIRAGMIENGYQLVQTRYSFEAFVKSKRAAYEQLS